MITEEEKENTFSTFDFLLEIGDPTADSVFLSSYLQLWKQVAHLQNKTVPVQSTCLCQSPCASRGKAECLHRGSTRDVLHFPHTNFGPCEKGASDPQAQSENRGISSLPADWKPWPSCHFLEKADSWVSTRPACEELPGTSSFILTLKQESWTPFTSRQLFCGGFRAALVFSCPLTFCL